MRGPETERSHHLRLQNGFYAQYMSGVGLDIGYKGSVKTAVPVLETAVGVDIDYPGYDGKTLPFEDESQDYVFASHVLEHIPDSLAAIREWYRVLKVGGHLIMMVPHMYLYERKQSLPSRWNEDHKRFYTPYLLLVEADLALSPNSWRVRHYCDNDRGFNYSIPPEHHAGGAYEIECVIQKIKSPTWEIK